MTIQCRESQTHRTNIKDPRTGKYAMKPHGALKTTVHAICIHNLFSLVSKTSRTKETHILSHKTEPPVLFLSQDDKMLSVS